MTIPAGLGKKSRSMWTGITKEYELRHDELRILEDACREVDLIERLQVDLDSAELIVRGSQGQPVANPLVQEIRQHRGALARLLGQLRLTGESEAEVKGRSASARDLANARWRRGA